VTLEQIEAQKQKAAAFARNVRQDDDLADDLEDESLESYAERKRLTISNSPQRRRTAMADGSSGLMEQRERFADHGIARFGEPSLLLIRQVRSTPLSVSFRKERSQGGKVFGIAS
jgi:hypothetical protein